MNPVTLAIVGAGGRGSAYADFARKYPGMAKVVGVAEPRDFYRERLASAHGIPAGNCFRGWEGMAQRERFADAVLICTQDNMHVAPAAAFARKGYHIMLEKPMAPTPAGCQRIVRAVTENKVIFAVCHVMRYTAYTRKLKELLAAGAIGEIISLQHLEPVGYWHQAHSFVRGNWRNEKESSPMLLAKSCHDLDWIRYVMGAPCRRVSSFGSLTHFRRECKPNGAGRRCLECAIERKCPYSAVKIYLGRVKAGHTGWPVNVLTPDVSAAGVKKALRDGPYGRCVYECDNDVVDHQVVNMEFAGGQTASFTMTAFTKSGHRKTRIFGTRGEIYGDGVNIEIYDFLTDKTSVVNTAKADAGILGGHGGGDGGLMQTFVNAVAQRKPELILSGVGETLETHMMVFAAEQARKTGRVVAVRG